MSRHPRFVELEWDRGHDSFVGIVVAEGADGILLTPAPNLHPEPGFQWIARQELLTLKDLHEDAAAVRLAVIRNTGDRRRRSIAHRPTPMGAHDTHPCHGLPGPHRICFGTRRND